MRNPSLTLYLLHTQTENPPPLPLQVTKISKSTSFPSSTSSPRVPSPGSPSAASRRSSSAPASRRWSRRCSSDVRERSSARKVSPFTTTPVRASVGRSLPPPPLQTIRPKGTARATVVQRMEAVRRWESPTSPPLRRQQTPAAAAAAVRVMRTTKCATVDWWRTTSSMRLARRISEKKRKEDQNQNQKYFKRQTHTFHLPSLYFVLTPYIKTMYSFDAFSLSSTQKHTRFYIIHTDSLLQPKPPQIFHIFKKNKQNRKSSIFFL